MDIYRSVMTAVIQGDVKTSLENFTTKDLEAAVQLAQARDEGFVCFEIGKELGRREPKLPRTGHQA